MFSMCGILCRFLRGWRQNEAASLMTHAASLTEASLVVESISSKFKSGMLMNSINFFLPFHIFISYSIDPFYNETSSIFCQPFCEVKRRKNIQVIWKDNNKQAVLIYPKVIITCFLVNFAILLPYFRKK